MTLKVSFPDVIICGELLVRQQLTGEILISALMSRDMKRIDRDGKER